MATLDVDLLTLKVTSAKQLFFAMLQPSVYHALFFLFEGKIMFRSQVI